MAIKNEHFLFGGGVHPEDGKALSQSSPVQTAPLLEQYYVILQQHIGAPPKPLVKTGDTVKKGQKLAEAGGFVSAPVHAPTSGKVKLVDWPGASGVNLPAVEIAADGADTWADDIQPRKDWRELTPSVLREMIAAAGLVGMGGAAFPTAVKLSPPPEKPIDTLVLNGAECEPYLTADHRLMLEDAEKVLIGAEIFAKILGVKNIYLGIENNKPDAIEKMAALSDRHGVTVLPLRVMYPQGAEKQLIYAATERKVPTGGLPMDVGCVVQNVGTCAAAAEAVLEGKPLIERITTVTGTPIVNPGNWRFRLGTTVAKALELAGGVKEQPGKLILGGPMMGVALASLDVPIMKNASGILALAMDQIDLYRGQACIRCGRCVDACPMSLMPGTLSVMIESERFDLADYARVMDCVECGCCAYACPAARPLVQHMRRGKAEIIAKRKKG